MTIKLALVRALTSLAPLLISNSPYSTPIQPQMSVPYAISRFYPLPEETLLKAYSTGNAYLSEGKFNEALFEFNRAAELAPKSPDVFIARGIALEKVDRWQDAINDYRTANQLLKTFPFSKDDATAISNIANAETGLGQWDLALKDFTRAAELQSGFLAPQIGRALVLYQLNRKDEALSFFSNLADDYPAFPDGLAAFAVMSFDPQNPNNNANNSEIKEAWKTALEIDSRYLDLDWVRTIRRWPPKLCDQLQLFLKSPVSKV